MAENINASNHGRTALVLYGSETGNSEDVASQLGDLMKRLRFVTRISEMDTVDLNTLLNFSIVVFVISTAGQGEFPQNARMFWKKLLRKRLPHDCLCHVSFTTFGLGDSSYIKFNVSARKLHKRLLQLGAKEIYQPGEADDQHPDGLDGTYLSWSHGFRSFLLSSYPLTESLAPIPPEEFLSPEYSIDIDHEYINSTSFSPIQFNERDKDYYKHASVNLKPKLEIADTVIDSVDQSSSISKSLQSQSCIQSSPDLKDHPALDLSCQSLPPEYEHIPIPNSYKAKLKCNKRMTPNSHFQDVRELSFIVKEELNYQPGDSIIIFPKNFPGDVDTLIKLMKWEDVADKPLRFVTQNPEYTRSDILVPPTSYLHTISHTTLRQLLTHNLDITAIPKRRFFEFIAQHTEDPMHRDRLFEFANPMFTDEFYDYTSRPRRSILEVLQDFPTVNLPWKYVLAIFPVMRGRAYSIASGGAEKSVCLKSEKAVQITILVAIVEYRTILKKIRRGLCSRYLAYLKEDTEIRIVLKRSDSFYKLAQKSPQLPLILVGPGTGIAPCRSLILERGLQMLAPNNNVEIGQNCLFFGGRNRAADYFYEEEWTATHLRTRVFPAFSRDQAKKVYVQDLIRLEANFVSTLILAQGAIIYVCGSSGSMPLGVKEALIFALTRCELKLVGVPFTRESALLKLAELEKNGRFIQETW
ncbi:BgTH12-04634 [Blumeria graminis f. sp. triticale]|uniref:NADPH-dependent diflavin oxidoreductase 1 n=4 Tax=Blumeria graminis TaxID=34373 RepID=A0A656KEX1_BLUGR|nr:hypothetical protein BGT96224_30 [Blumeria graminis f. sp. tritici 96224]CAD6498980.1 BgTH12-04634 [Blumeria graminis f. sp. triticale]VCU39111.1 Bgt-30 [Blumeria graminis f. sp. tritici]